MRNTDSLIADYPNRTMPKTSTITLGALGGGKGLLEVGVGISGAAVLKQAEGNGTGLGHGPIGVIGNQRVSIPHGTKVVFTDY